MAWEFMREFLAALPPECRPDGGEGFLAYFLCPTKSRKIAAARRRKDLILLVGSCRLSGLIRGLQNLESPFWKGVNFASAKPPLWRAESRFEKPRKTFQRKVSKAAERQKDLILLVRRCYLGGLNRSSQNLETPCKGERIYSFRLYEKNQKYPRGLRTSGLRGRFKSPLDTRFWRK